MGKRSKCPKNKNGVIQCSKKNKINRCRLDPLKCVVIYESYDTPTKLELPRYYTSTHDDEKELIYISIGSEYNQSLLDTAEVRNVESQVVGKWCKRKGEYEIRLRVIVSSTKNPQAAIRNTIICAELGPVLNAIALAESGLLTNCPSLGRAKIYVHFESIDLEYKRVECWGCLKYWQCKDRTEDCSSDSSCSSTCTTSYCNCSNSSSCSSSGMCNLSQIPCVVCCCMPCSCN